NARWPAHYVDKVVHGDADLDGLGYKLGKIPKPLGYHVGIAADEIDNLGVGGRLAGLGGRGQLCVLSPPKAAIEESTEPILRLWIAPNSGEIFWRPFLRNVGT